MFKLLVNATRGVVEVYKLGVELEISVGELDTIEANNCNNVDKARIKLLDYWLRNDQEASWSKLAGALRDVGYRDLSNSILKKYVDGKIYSLIYIILSFCCSEINFFLLIGEN